MTFRRAMSVTATILGLFGIYLFAYSTYVLWDYHTVEIRETFDRDSHGMSLVIGYTFIFFLGTVTFGLGIVAWFSRQVTESKAQDALTLGLFLSCLCGLLVSLYLQIKYWQTNWGRFYIAIFVTLVLILGYKRFLRNSTSEGHGTSSQGH